MQLKVAITGHTKGIGAAFAEYFKEENVFGFSRENGWDLEKKTACDALLKNVKDFDVFINNAPVTNQEYLFDEMYKLWRGKNKSIINLSSSAGDISKDNSEQLDNLLPVSSSEQKERIKHFKKYCETKRSLDNKISQTSILGNVLHDGKPYVLNMKPGGVDSGADITSLLVKRVLTLEDFMEIFKMCWNLKDSTARITSITFAGNNPSKQ